MVLKEKSKTDWTNMILKGKVLTQTKKASEKGN